MVGFAASMTLPLFNIPLMMRMIKRRSSTDISLIWACGVFVCIVATLPAAWISTDIIFKSYQIVNVIFFSGVVVLAVYYRRKQFHNNPIP